MVIGAECRAALLAAAPFGAFAPFARYVAGSGEDDNESRASTALHCLDGLRWQVRAAAEQLDLWRFATGNDGTTSHEVSSNRVPDRVVMSTCGTETPKPFACKVFVYKGGLRAGQYDPKLSVVFEDVRGHWIVTQWL